MNKSRNYSYDIIRIVACLLVIFTHCPLHTADSVNHSFFLSSMAFLVRPCIGLFIMISGALLLPTKEEPKEFFKRRMSKILLPTLLWSIIYVLLMDMRHNGIVEGIIGLPFRWQGHPVLWYMYTLIGLYLLSPVLSAWLKSCSKHILEFYLLLWGITLCYPYIDLISSTEISNEGILYYYTGYVGYFVMGYYLKIFGQKINFTLITIIALISFCIPIAHRIFEWEFDQSYAFGYLSLVVANITVFSYLLIVKLCSKLHFNNSKILTCIANLTFGVYLIHILVLKYLVWPMLISFYNGAYCISSILAGILTFSISCLICYTISLVPGAKYIIGYQANSSPLRKVNPQSGGGIDIQ